MFGFRLDIASPINAIVDFIVGLIAPVLRTLSRLVEDAFDATVDGILFSHPMIAIVVIALVLWRLGDIRIAVFGLVTLTLVAFMGFWSHMVDTITLVVFATCIALAVAIPLGILMGISDKVAAALRPVLDLMQTMPAFVYLIPAVMLFALGKPPAVFATMIWAMPPAIRLTNLGIREVAKETMEAASSFGATRWQMLYKVQIPLAMPTIMAGVNQCIMMALSMAVITSMIGGGGLGNEVLRGLGRLDVGYGFSAGISIVFLAIILDRTAAAMNRRAVARAGQMAMPAAAPPQRTNLKWWWPFRFPFRSAGSPP